MRLLFISFYLLFNWCFLKGQVPVNLVPNYSFEQQDTCPFGTNQIYFAVPWFQPNIIGGNTVAGSSTDYYNVCASTSSMVSVPSNITGFQFAKTGVAYAGGGGSVGGVI
jgi:hypothetical protein